MAGDTLSTELKFAEVSSNVTGEPTPLVEWGVPDGAELTVRQGQPAIIDAATTDGGTPSNATRLGLGYREPNDPLDAYTVFSDFSIAPFNTLSLRDQNSGDNAQRRRVRFDPDRIPGGALSLSDADSLALIALSPDEIDPEELFFNYPMAYEEA